MIHNSAYIDKTAIIADDAEIGPMCYIGPGCVVESKAKLGVRVTLDSNTIIGSGTKISSDVSLGGDPQDLSYKGEDTKLIIGKNNIIREFVSINRGSNKEDGITLIGDDCYIMASVHIGHDCKIGNKMIVACFTAFSGHVRVADNCVISGLGGIHQFVRMGEGCMVGGVSRVTKDVPPYTMVYDDSIFGLNLVGLRRRGVSADVISELKKALRFYSDKKLLLKDVKAELENLVQYPEVVKFKEFFTESKRGIVRSFGRDA